LKISMEAAGGGADFTAYPRFYIPYATAARDAAGRGQPLAKLGQSSPEHAEAVANLVRSSGKAIDELVFLPLRTRTKPMSIVIGKAEGDVVGVLMVDPH